MSIQNMINLIAVIGLGGIVQALVGYFSNRRKITSEVKLNDIQSLEKKLAYLEKIMATVESHNDRLRKDLEAAEGRERVRAQRIRELEDELDAVRRSALDTQRQCESLTARLREMMESQP